MPEEKHIIKADIVEDEFEDIAIDMPVQMSGVKKKELAIEICEKIKKSIDDTSGFVAKLTKWNNLVEGITEERSGSNIHIPMPNVKLTGIVDKISETLNEMPYFFMIKSDKLEDTKKQAIQQHVQNILNDMGWQKNLEGILFNAGEQRTAIVAQTYDTEKIAASKWGYYSDETEFKKEYPNAEKAGISKEQYGKILKDVISPGGTRIQETYYRIKKGQKIDIINRQDFILCPADVLELKKAEGQFSRAHLTDQDYKIGIRDKKYEKSDIDALYAKINASGKDDKDKPRKTQQTTQETNAIETNKNAAIGINVANKTGRESFVGIYRYDLDEDGIKEYLLITVDYKAQHILRIREYPYFSGESYFKKIVLRQRVNRFDGMGIIELLEHLVIQLNNIYNQENDGWNQVLSKTFLMKYGVEVVPEMVGREGIELGTVYQIGEGVDDVRKAIMHLFQDIQGLQFMPQRVAQILKFIDDITVSDQLLTGKESPTDPKAPMGKTIALLRMAASKIAGYIRHSRPGLNSIGEGILWLEYQFGPDEYTETISGEDITFTKDDIFPDNIDIEISVSDSRLNQAILKAMAQEALGVVAPFIEHNPPGVQELLDNYLTHAQFSGDKKKVIMTQKELTDLLMQMMQAKQAEEQAAAEEEERKGQEEYVKEGEKLSKDMSPEEIDEAESEVAEEVAETT